MRYRHGNVQYREGDNIDVKVWNLLEAIFRGLDLSGERYDGVTATRRNHGLVGLTFLDSVITALDT